MGTKTKFVSVRIVVDAEDETLCGLGMCPHYRKDDVAGRTARNCRLFFRGLNPLGPTAKRCDECLGAKEL